MKLAQEMGQTVYLYGVTGLGKTSFVKDYFVRQKVCILFGRELYKMAV